MYFLKAKSDYVSPGLPDELESSESDTVLSKDRPLISKSSDLSNLQIVKKVGRQLSPFLEMEKKYIARLEGPQTSKKDAQKMYQYIFGKTFQKSTPLPWQQLSRRRHK